MDIQHAPFSADWDDRIEALQITFNYEVSSHSGERILRIFSINGGK